MRFLSAKRLSLSLLGLFLCLILGAKEIPPRPNTLVNDYAGALSPDQKASLEKKLVDFDNKTSNQIAIVLDKSLEDESLEDYVNRLFIAWGIGGKKNNNGVLIYAAMKEKKIRIEAAYGLEPVITDAASSQIIREEIKPAFTAGDYYEGLDRATDALMHLASKEYNAPRKGNHQQPGHGLGIPPFAIIIIVIVAIIILARIFRGGGGGGPFGGFTSGTGPFFGGGGFGGGGGGFSGGGGFGGFGGGSSGGGGASGDW